MSRRKRYSPAQYNCTLDPQAPQRNFCQPNQCEYCGWGRMESQVRSEYLRQYGLTVCRDGLRRLVMKPELESTIRATHWS